MSGDRRLANIVIALCVFSGLLFGCGSSSESGAGECDESVVLESEGEQMRMNQNEQYTIGSRDYSVGNMGPVDVDGEEKLGAQLWDGETDLEFFDCDVVTIDGRQYRASFESKSVLFEAVAE